MIVQLLYSKFIVIIKIFYNDKYKISFILAKVNLGK